MFEGSIKIDRGLPNFINTKFPKWIKDGQNALDNRILKDCNPFVPMDTGMLSLSGRVDTEAYASGKGGVSWHTPYAKRMYYGDIGKPEFNFSRDKHPKATHRWFEKAKSIYGKQWVTIAKSYIGKGKSRRSTGGE